MIINSGKVESNESSIKSGGTALTLNKESNVTLIRQNEIYSYEGNGIEVNDGSVVNIISNTKYILSHIFGSQNTIYLNGGTANLSGNIALVQVVQDMEYI